MKNKVPIHVVSKMLGHANVAFTMNTYIHILKGQLEELEPLDTVRVVSKSGVSKSGERKLKVMS